jgi:hypothetical protein
MGVQLFFMYKKCTVVIAHWTWVPQLQEQKAGKTYLQVDLKGGPHGEFRVVMDIFTRHAEMNQVCNVRTIGLVV